MQPYPIGHKIVVKPDLEAAPAYFKSEPYVIVKSINETDYAVYCEKHPKYYSWVGFSEVDTEATEKLNN